MSGLMGSLYSNPCCSERIFVNQGHLGQWGDTRMTSVCDLPLFEKGSLNLKWKKCLKQSFWPLTLESIHSCGSVSFYPCKEPWKMGALFGGEGVHKPPTCMKLTEKPTDVAATLCHLFVGDSANPLTQCRSLPNVLPGLMPDILFHPKEEQSLPPSSFWNMFSPTI